MTRGQFTMRRCNIAGIEAVEAQTRHAFPRHTHEQFGIGLIHRGAQKSLSGRGMVEAGPGDMITVNPGEVHDGMPIGEAGRSWKMLYIDPLVIADIRLDISEGKIADFEFSRPVMTAPPLAGRFQSLFAAVTVDSTGDAAMRGQETLLMLLAELLPGQQRLEIERSIPKAVSRSKTLIDDDPTAALTLADLARESGMSRFQLLRGFSRATGLTPHAYLIQRRIHLARRLIAAGTSLADAAIDSGFADQSHMTRIFTRNYGVSPGTYALAMN